MSNFTYENLPLPSDLLDLLDDQTPYNYHRALVWAAVMTALSHLDPNFTTVAAIQAIKSRLWMLLKPLG